MKEIELKYGCNPGQKPAKLYMKGGEDLPLEVLNGTPGYINFLDALNAWQLVRELKETTGLAAATSFKHVSPTSAAVGVKLGEKLKKAYFADDVQGLDDSPVACAYARARGTDRLCSFGDFIALSDECDEVTARLIAREVSDGIIAPSYSKKAFDILKEKKKGNYAIVKIDPSYEPAEREEKQVFGVTFSQKRNNALCNAAWFENVVTKEKSIPPEKLIDLKVALVTLKYTQSNSVVFAYDSQAIGVGAGQQSRIHCTRLAGSKADTWFLRQYDRVLSLPFKEELTRVQKDNVIDAFINETEEDVTESGIWEKYFTSRPSPLTAEEKRAYLSSIKGVSLASDAFFPFSDNVVRAVKSGVRFIAEPGGSVRDQEVIDKCDELGVVMVFTGQRLFHH